MKKLILGIFILFSLSSYVVVSQSPQMQQDTVKIKKKKKPWYKRKMDAFAGFPSVTSLMEDAQSPSDLFWFYPHENVPPEKSHFLIGPVLLSIIAFNYMRIANMALAAAASLAGISYHIKQKLNDKSGMLHFSKLLLHDALVALVAQGVAFNLENFIHYSHQKLIRRYPFFRTKRGDTLFKSIAYLVKLGFPFLVFYAHYKIKPSYKELKI